MEPFAHQDEYVGWLRQQIRYHISRAEWLARQTRVLMDTEVLLSNQPFIDRFPEDGGVDESGGSNDEQGKKTA